MTKRDYLNKNIIEVNQIDAEFSQKEIGCPIKITLLKS